VHEAFQLADGRALGDAPVAALVPERQGELLHPRTRLDAREHLGVDLHAAVPLAAGPLQGEP